MTPKEKAEELINELFERSLAVHDSHIDCKYLIDEIIRCMPSVNGRPPNYQDVNEYCSEYWKEVKNELNKLGT